ncbi:sigma-54-dependent transcriptional regulator [Marilutibacter alkalisoli]|uniref:Sigma-54-dependent Fis family transcriptional regulator n=1 Tax=Marilutibacter alkalisoli TaxID=2591633 RepID=A0A514BNQ6_9GAMM|nr:sigma-54 dependent transcriptional regulator [Lysobacter alkalisoli]QDH69021.1 sigma-54-dependent Fis family transcriptional regulator [Lysobacter alkalisoli]
MPTILVIDDNPSVAIALEVLFSLHGIQTLHAESPSEGLDILSRASPDLVIQDMNFHADTTSGHEGETLFNEIRTRHPGIPIVLLTAWTRLESAVELIKAGATDYIAKPWDDHKLMITLGNLLELSANRRELQRRIAREQHDRDALERDHDLCGMVWADAASERVLAMAVQVARSKLPVLVTGPNGAGKEKIAEIIHANSTAHSGPFVALNCGALPADLIEAELFGADAGAYTGASRAREGKFEAADGGTIFLDEIANLSLEGQAKLLRVLETGRFERLGSNREKQVHVRVLSATNANLSLLIEQGRFREDLYYRLNAIELRLPSLAERPDDILPLARHFLPPGKLLLRSAEQALLRHRWPGNVRELRNVMQRAALLSPTCQIDANALGMPALDSSSVIAREPDRSQIQAALERAGGVLAQAATELGLSRQALYRRMDKLGLRRN